MDSYIRKYIASIYKNKLNHRLKFPVYKLLYILNNKQKLSSHLNLTFHSKLSIHSKIKHIFRDISRPSNRRYSTFIKRFYSPKPNYKVLVKIHKKTVVFDTKHLKNLPITIKNTLFDQSNKICKSIGIGNSNVNTFHTYNKILSKPHTHLPCEIIFKKIDKTISTSKNNFDYFLEISKLRAMKEVKFNNPSDPLQIKINLFMEEFLSSIDKDDTFSFNLFLGLSSNVLPSAFTSSKLYLKTFRNNEDISLLVPEDYNEESFMSPKELDVNYILNELSFYKKSFLIDSLPFTDQHTFFFFISFLSLFYIFLV